MEVGLLLLKAVQFTGADILIPGELVLVTDVQACHPSGHLFRKQRHLVIVTTEYQSGTSRSEIDLVR